MHDNIDQPLFSSASRGQVQPVRKNIREAVNVSWHIVVIAAVYALVSMLAAGFLGQPPRLAALGISLLSGILIAAAAAPVATRLLVSHGRQWIVWGSVLFLNTLSVVIEGAFLLPP